MYNSIPGASLEPPRSLPGATFEPPCNFPLLNEKVLLAAARSTFSPIQPPCSFLGASLQLFTPQRKILLAAAKNIIRASSEPPRSLPGASLELPYSFPRPQTVGNMYIIASVADSAVSKSRLDFITSRCSLSNF